MATDIQVKSNFAHSARVDIKSKPHGYGFFDPLATIEAAGYFNPVSQFLNLGDQIAVEASDGVALFIVTILSPSVVIERLDGASSRSSAVGNFTGGVATGASATPTKIIVGVSLPVAAHDFMVGLNTFTYTGTTTKEFMITYDWSALFPAAENYSFSVAKNSTNIPSSNMNVFIPTDRLNSAFYQSTSWVLSLSTNDTVEAFVTSSNPQNITNSALRGFIREL